MTDESFQELVREGIANLPIWVQKKLVNVVFFVKDDVTPDQREKEKLRSNETLYGLYEGVPLSERGNNPVMLPDTITIFKDPILQNHKSDDEVRTCVINTVWHEVAHFMGHSEEWVRFEEKEEARHTNVKKRPP